jgi:hypothetical protein
MAVNDRFIGENVALTRALLQLRPMKAIPWLTGLIGSYAGWYLGAPMGIFMGLMLSIVGGAVGGYYGNKWVRQNL